MLTQPSWLQWDFISFLSVTLLVCFFVPLQPADNGIPSISLIVPFFPVLSGTILARVYITQQESVTLQQLERISTA